MKYSILIPSKNGEKYIRNVILSVLDQDYKNYEIIVGDNNNSSNFKKILKKFGSKIKVVKHKKDIPVYDNWQSCLNKAKGDYMIMLGDDDCLLKGALRKLNNIIIENNKPDCVTVNGISFYDSGCLNNSNKCGYKNLYFDYKLNRIDEGFLTDDTKEEIIKKIFSFKNLLPLNMQPHIVSIKYIKRNYREKIFQAPFPDHYAIHSLLIKNCKWYISYKKIVGVGINNKSFGNYFYSNKINEGMSYLGINIKSFKFDFIPGSVLNNCMLVWLNKLKKNYSYKLKNIEIDRSEYVSRQFFYSINCYINSSLKLTDLINFILKLSVQDLFFLFKGFFKITYYNKAIAKVINFKSSKFGIQGIKIIQNKNTNIYKFTREKIR